MHSDVPTQLTKQAESQLQVRASWAQMVADIDDGEDWSIDIYKNYNNVILNYIMCHVILYYNNIITMICDITLCIMFQMIADDIDNGCDWSIDIYRNHNNIMLNYIMWHW